MTELTNYACEKCGARIDRSDRTEAPDCCGQPMTAHKPLPVCEITETAEHSRMENFGEPCDDGRGKS